MPPSIEKRHVQSHGPEPNSVFYGQPLAHRFGTRLIEQLKDERWSSLDLAVAWVRQSGMMHLLEPARSFLQRGNTLTVVVGVDLYGTSSEGLAALLELESCGRSETYVHHNEGNGIFHPKLFLWRNAAQASLVVASNNLTEAGLFLNTEAGLELSLDLAHPTVTQVVGALTAWRDEDSGLAKRLTPELLRALRAGGYIRTEDELRRTAPSGDPPGIPASRTPRGIFARRQVSAPPHPHGVAAARTASRPTAKRGPRSEQLAQGMDGRVLLMRVRKAHGKDRPTQTQIPKAAYETEFFTGVHHITSSHSGESHAVTEAAARGIVNTLKLEVPEMRTLSDPVLRLERSESGIAYEVYDSHSPQGKQIMATLRAGLSDSARPTTLTRPNDPDSATWWRFI